MVRIEVPLKRLNPSCSLLALQPPCGSAGRPLEELLQLPPKGPNDPLPVLTDGIDHDDPLAEPGSLQPLADYLERGLFLANDKEAPAGPDCVSDHVDDGLALTCSRRTLDEEPSARSI